MPKTLKKFCEIIRKAGKNSLDYYQLHLDRMVEMYGLSLTDEDYEDIYFTMCDRRMHFLEI